MLKPTIRLFVTDFQPVHPRSIHPSIAAPSPTMKSVFTYFFALSSLVASSLAAPAPLTSLDTPVVREVPELPSLPVFADVLKRGITSPADVIALVTTLKVNIEAHITNIHIALQNKQGSDLQDTCNKEFNEITVLISACLDIIVAININLNCTADEILSIAVCLFGIIQSIVVCVLAILDVLGIWVILEAGLVTLTGLIVQLVVAVNVHAVGVLVQVNAQISLNGFAESCNKVLIGLPQLLISAAL